MGCSSSKALSAGEGSAGDDPPAVRHAGKQRDKGSLAAGKASIKGPGQLERSQTTRSSALAETLDRLEVELTEMQETSAAAREVLSVGTAKTLPLGLRSELASLHGSANKLLATRLDAIVTADLTTGREEARARRKKLVAAAEELIETLESQIKQIDQIKSRDDDAASQPALAHAPTLEADLQLAPQATTATTAHGTANGETAASEPLPAPV